MPGGTNFKVIALDPGGTTGYAWAEINDGKVTDFGGGQGQLTEGSLHAMLSAICPSAIVAESFEFRQRQRDGLVLVSRNLLGVSRLWAELRDVPHTEQSAAQGKAFFTDQKLRAVGAYTRGSPHKNDATRHLLYWLTFSKGARLLEKPYYKGQIKE